MAALPKVLLITHGRPGGCGAGESYLTGMCCGYPGDRLVRYGLIDSPYPERQWCGYPLEVRVVRTSCWPVCSTIRHRNFLQSGIERLMEDVAELRRRTRPDLLWIVLNSAEMIGLAARLSERSRVPLGFTIWDAPRYLLEAQRLDPVSVRLTLLAFDRVVRRAFHIGVVSDGMGRYLRETHGVASTTILPGVNLQETEGTGRPEASARPKIIAFAGSIYAKREWNALIDALESSEGQVGSSSVEVHHWGPIPRWGVKKAKFVKFLGSVSQAAVLAALQRADLAYLPYWMDERHAHAVQTAFPSKLATYVAAGLPILYHGPAESTPAEFLREHVVGLICNSCGRSEILGALARLLSDGQLREQMAAARTVALRTHLSTAEMARRWTELLKRYHASEVDAS